MKGDGDCETVTVIEVVVKEEVWQSDVCSSNNVVAATKCETCGSQHCPDTKLVPEVEEEAPDTSMRSEPPDSSQAVTVAGSFDGEHQPLGKRSRTDFTPAQKEAVNALFDRGVQGFKSPSDKEDIERTAAFVGLSVHKVAQALYTRASKIKRPTEPRKFKYSKRKLRPYDIYKRDHLAGNFNKEGMQALARGWKDVKDRGQMLEYKRRAEEENDARSRRSQDKGVVKRHLQKQLGALVKELQGIGVETVLMMADGELETSGSSQGEDFLRQHPDIEDRWFAYCVGTDKVAMDEASEALRVRIRTLLNKKYSDAIGQVGKRVPYNLIDEGEVLVTGLPMDIALKRPCHYGRRTMECLLATDFTLSVIRRPTIPTSVAPPAVNAVPAPPVKVVVLYPAV